jgi:hypothetical protein
MEIRVIFNGSPDEFVKVLDDYWRREKQKDPNSPRSYQVYKKNREAEFGLSRSPDPGHVVHWWAVPVMAYIKALPWPGEKTALVITTRDEFWEVLEPVWRETERELQRQGWIGKKGGRPREEIYNKIAEDISRGMSEQEAMRTAGLDPYNKSHKDKVDKALERRKD